MLPVPSHTNSAVQTGTDAVFQCRNGWYVQFLECDLKTPLRKTVTFASEDKLIEMDERGKADLNLESRAAIQHGIEIGKAALPKSDGGAVSALL